MSGHAGDTDDADTADGDDQGPRHVERIRARGHENVRAEHGSTLEVTSDDWLTPAGDCILAVGADRTPTDFDPDFVAACRDREARITATLRVSPAGSDESATPTEAVSAVVVEGRGHPDLTFDGDRSAVCRTSDYVDDRTVMVEADRAAADVARDVVRALAAGADCEFVLRVF